jgi:hypothetical protein
MDNEILVVTNYALVRLLKEFAQKFGMDEVMSDVTAQVHMQISRIPGGWNTWLREQCNECTKHPGECDFLNPKEKNCLGGATPADVQAGNSIVIEIGKLKECPSKRTESQHKNLAETTSSAGAEHVQEDQGHRPES